MYQFDKREVKQEFIHNTESGIYTGTNVNGEDVVVIVEQGQGMDVKTIRKAKPRWFEVIEYDSEWYQVSIAYESLED